MKKLKLGLTLIFCLLLGMNCSKWSDEQGNMTWSEADNNCKTIGMRLPRIDELKEAYKTGKSIHWEGTSSTYYWSSTPDGINYLVMAPYFGEVLSYGSQFTAGVKCHK